MGHLAACAVSARSGALLQPGCPRLHCRSRPRRRLSAPCLLDEYSKMPVRADVSAVVMVVACCAAEICVWGP